MEFRYIISAISLLMIVGKLGTDGPMVRCVLDASVKKRGQLDFLNLVQIAIIWALVTLFVVNEKSLSNHLFLIITYTTATSFNLIYGESKCLIINRLHYLYATRIIANLASVLCFFLLYEKLGILGILWMLCFIEICISITLALFVSRIEVPNFANFINIFASLKNRKFFTANTFSIFASTQTYQCFEIIFLGKSTSFSVAGAYAAITLVAQLGLSFSLANLVRGFTLKIMVRNLDKPSVLLKMVFAIISFSSIQILALFVMFRFFNSTFTVDIFNEIDQFIPGLIFLNYLMSGILLSFAPLVSATKSFHALYFTGTISLLSMIIVIFVQPTVETLVLISVAKNLLLIIFYYTYLTHILSLKSNQFFGLLGLATMAVAILTIPNLLLQSSLLAITAFLFLPTTYSVWQEHRGAFA